MTQNTYQNLQQYGQMYQNQYAAGLGGYANGGNLQVDPQWYQSQLGLLQHSLFEQYINQIERRHSLELAAARQARRMAPPLTAAEISVSRRARKWARVLRVIRWMAYLSILVYAFPAHAADPYVRLRNAGSGTIIVHKKKLYVLTCAHVVPNAGNTVLFQRGRNPEWLRGTVASVDTGRDLALVEIPKFTDVAPVEVADESPQQVDVEVIGFGKNHYVARRGTANGRVDMRIRYRDKRLDARKVRTLLSVGVPGRMRDSGAPVMYRGKIVGVVIGIDPEHSVAVPVEDIRAFLRGK